MGELRSSSCTRGISMPNFEVLDARIASALNKIINNSQFKRRISLEEQKTQKEDRFLRGRQIAYLIYDHFRVTGTHDSVENYTDLFTIVLRNDDLQEFDSKWDGILLSMTKIPHDDILEGLYKLRIRESEKLKTVLELYDLETHQKKLALDYHRLKTMVKRSIEQEILDNEFAFAEEACHVRFGQLQLQRTQEHILDFERDSRTRSKNCHCFKVVTTNSVEALMTALAQPPAAIAIVADSVSSSSILTVSRGVGAVRTLTTKFLSSVMVQDHLRPDAQRLHR